MEQLLNYVRPEYVIIAVVLYAIGLFLKANKSFKAEWAIPYIILATGILLSVVYSVSYLGGGFTAVSVIDGLFQGIIISAIVVFGNELVKQVMNKRLEDK